MIDQDKVYVITSVVESGTFETMPVAPSMELISNDHLLHSDLHFAEQQKVCITSEYSLSTIIDKLDSVRKEAIEILKDKFKFRKMLENIYPDYEYKFVKLQDIKNLKLNKKSVIKPVKGCFGTAVRVIGADTNFEILSAELEKDLNKNAKVYPDSVLSEEDFIIEEYIEGEEYAIDMFYNSNGEPCIVNIFHHPVPENETYIHMVYNSSKKEFDDTYNKLKEFLLEINKTLNVKNFVMHVEVKVWDGKIYPIEINSMRYGGMGLCNLGYYSLGINPFVYFLNDNEPDWEHIWKNNAKDVFTFFIAYNGINKPVERFKPDREKLKKQFTKVLHEQPFDYQKQLAFGIYFLKETKENISNLLKIEFDDFFEERNMLEEKK